MANQFLVKETMAAMRGLSAAEITALQNGTYEGVQLLGYYQKGDTPAPIVYYRAPTTPDPGPDDGGSIIDLGTVKLVHEFNNVVDSSYFGVSETLADNSTMLEKSISYCKLNNPCILKLPKGNIKYTSLPNLGKGMDGNTIKGYAPNMTVLQHLGSGIAFNLNAFEGATTTTPFAKNITIQDINILGNSNTTTGIYIEGLARCIFKNIRINGGNTTEGISIVNGAQLSHFYNLRSSYNDGAVSYIGMRTIASVRKNEDSTKDDESSNCSNNTYYDIQLEGHHTGIQLTRTDQNTFIGGTVESCKARGMSISGGLAGGGRYNTFIGVGFESCLADYDIIDSGEHNSFIGCYALRVELQSKMSKISSGYYDLIKISSGTDNILENVTYSHWKQTPNGLLDPDPNKRTIKINTYDAKASKKDVNNGRYDGSVSADSFRTKAIADYKANVSTVDSYGGFVPFNNGAAIDQYIFTNGSGIALNRRGIHDTTPDIGAWRLWTSATTDNDILFLKMTANNVWTASQLVSDKTLATPSKKGIVNQAAVSADTAVASSGATPSKAEYDTLLAELRDLKTKLRASGILAT